ncbi:MAG TPA: 3',5'-cyclic-nucleotide phosphodiesterase [Pyrinomonadaceae bacterium]|nr:3',5'-cyclic-nucleotide phosphodiesterase [Pyrinomonadaceae bacterium]
MKIRLLPSSFDDDGRATQEQRLSCFVIDDRVTIDAGSVALSLGERGRAHVRDVIVTHPHMDHVATLPIFVDDLFATLEEPVRVHATPEVITLLKRDIFNGTVYPPFHEFRNGRTHVMEFVPIEPGREFAVAHLRATAVGVTHIVPTVGLVLSDGERTIAFSSDTSATEEFWQLVNRQPRLDALIVETSFPDRLAQLAEVSGHLTPASLRRELGKLEHEDVPVLVMHLKPAYREVLINELDALDHPHLSAMEVGREYSW